MSTAETLSSRSDELSQILMVQIGEETFALDAGMVREIIDPVAATPVARARPHLPALINVRGHVIPLADLRVRFGMAVTEKSKDTRFVVIEIEMDEESVSLAIIADKVLEVTQVAMAQFYDVPRLGTRWRPELIQCMVKWKEDFAIVPEMKMIVN